MTEVRDAESADHPEWHRMWLANCAHYGVSIPAADDRELWRRIMDPEYPVGSLVAGAPIGKGPLVGFANYVLRPHTFSSRMVCYLEDLWVEPSARAAGWGRKFIDALIARGHDLGAGAGSTGIRKPTMRRRVGSMTASPGSPATFATMSPCRDDRSRILWLPGGAHWLPQAVEKSVENVPPCDFVQCAIALT